MATLPAPLTTGTIVGEFFRVPEGTPIEGAVQISPNVEIFRVTEGGSAVALPSVVVGLVKNGILTDVLGAPLTVLASDSPGISPTGFQYTAQFALRAVDDQPTSVVFSVPTGSTIDLANIIPEAVAPAVVHVVTESSRIAAEAAADRAEAAAALAEEAGAGFLVLATGAPVPPGTLSGTIIVRPAA